MPERKDFETRKTLCWDCKNACGRCSWSREFKPVDGWEAVPSKVYQHENCYADSYIVQKCPMFEKDAGDYIEKITVVKMAEILGCTPRRVSDLADGYIRSKCKSKGIKVKICYTQNHSRMIYKVSRDEKPHNTTPHISNKLLKLFFGKQKGYTGF